MNLPLKVKELPRLVNIVTYVRNNLQSSHVTLEKDSNFMSKHLPFISANPKPYNGKSHPLVDIIHDKDAHCPWHGVP